MKADESLPMLNHSNRDEAPPPVRNRRQSAIDRAARLVDIHHTVLHVPNDLVANKEGNSVFGNSNVSLLE